jgi:hypothetical protein
MGEGTCITLQVIVITCLLDLCEIKAFVFPS